jgi:secreted trypsin-like serine protease
MHKKFNASRGGFNGFDICLIFLKGSSSKTPVRIDKSPPTGSPITIIGMGKTTVWTIEETKESDPDLFYGSKSLMKARVYKMANDEQKCSMFALGKQKSQKVNGERSKFLCLGGTNSTACHGDSGGPAIFWKKDKPYVVGVTSFGNPSCQKYNGQFSVIYTDVGYYLKWIDAVIRMNSKHRRRT